MKQDQFQEIFCSSFTDGPEWRKWFFDAVAVDDDQIYIAADNRGKAASALLMQPYSFLFHGYEMPTGYISCVATLPENRSQGLASRLLLDALHAAYEKGYAMCELIPAEDHLYYFYSSENFATVFYTDRERYTSLHSFHPGRGALVEPSYELFHALEVEQGCGILHSESDYANILADLALDGGEIVLAATDDDGASAMLFAVNDGPDAVKVKCLIGMSKYAVRTVLCELRRRVGDKAITVLRPPLSGDKAFLHPFGMGRIVDAAKILGILAAAHPDLHITIRLRDEQLPHNTGVYVVKDGVCQHTPWREGKFDLDIAPDTLAAILFSSHDTGEIFDLPARRPYMALMLD